MRLLTDILTRTANAIPDKDAFGCKGEALTYAELDQAASQVANTLIDRGVTPGDRVGIYLEKSLHAAVAIYGILRAGGVYVPLDPAAPAAKTDAIVDSCAIAHLVSSPLQASKVARLLAVFDVVVGIDAGDMSSVSWEEVAEASITDPAIQMRGADPAYIIFTSGSTGDPKGIVHTHDSALAFIKMSVDLYEVGPDDRLSNFPPLHFDQSIFDYFSGASVGATTIILTEPEQLVPASLAKRIEEERLTIWYSVPFALIQLLLWGAIEERHIDLRWVIFGGEPFPLKHLKALMDVWPNAKFSNCYGPAETNQCTFYTVPVLDAQAVVDDARIPIGEPCESVSFLIVDEADTAVSDGEGELLISGPTTMQSYWGRSATDPASFLIKETEGQVVRYYRTGDVVMLDGDGMIDFLGRKDRQVKTRGYRVELDEVEAAFASHPDVAIAGVYSVGDADGTVVLAAAVQLHDGAVADSGSLRKHAAAKVPRYALPATIDVVDEFPRTTSGKIDYRALSRRS